MTAVFVAGLCVGFVGGFAFAAFVMLQAARDDEYWKQVEEFKRKAKGK
jgi:hypothetical protein